MIGLTARQLTDDCDVAALDARGPPQVALVPVGHVVTAADARPVVLGAIKSVRAFLTQVGNILPLTPSLLIQLPLDYSVQDIYFKNGKTL